MEQAPDQLGRHAVAVQVAAVRRVGGENAEHVRHRELPGLELLVEPDLDAQPAHAVAHEPLGRRPAHGHARGAPGSAPLGLLHRGDQQVRERPLRVLARHDVERDRLERLGVHPRHERIGHGLGEGLVGVVVRDEVAQPVLVRPRRVLGAMAVPRLAARCAVRSHGRKVRR